MIDGKSQKMLSMLIALTLLLGIVAPVGQVIGESGEDEALEGGTDENLDTGSTSLQSEHTRYITEDEYINETERKEDNNIVIESDGHLQIINSTLTMMLNEEGHTWNITVRDGGQLSLSNSTIKTNPDPTLLRPFLKTDVTVTGGSSLLMEKNSSFRFPGFVNIESSEFEMIDSTFEALEDVPSYDYLWDGDQEDEAVDDNDDGPRLFVTDGSDFYMENSRIDDYYTFDEDTDMWEMSWYPLDEDGEEIVEVQDNEEEYLIGGEEEEELLLEDWFLENPFISDEYLGEYPYINPSNMISSLYVEIEYSTRENYTDDEDLATLDYTTPGGQTGSLDIHPDEESNSAPLWEIELSEFFEGEKAGETRWLIDEGLEVSVENPQTGEDFGEDFEVEIEQLRLVSSYDNDIHIRESSITVINSFIDVDIKQSDIDPRTRETATDDDTYLQNSNVDHRVLRIYDSSFKSYGLSIEDDDTDGQEDGDPWILNTESSHDQTWIYRWVDLQVTNEDGVPLPGATVDPNPDNRIEELDETVESINDPDDNPRALEYMQEHGNGTYVEGEDIYEANEEGRITMFLASDRINYPGDWPNSEYVGNYLLDLTYEDEDQGIFENATSEISLEHFPKMDNPESISAQIPVDLPDLEAEDLRRVEEDQPIIPEDEVDLIMNVSNVGDADASDVNVSFYQDEFDPDHPDENLFDHTILDGLGEDESEEVETTWDAPVDTGSYTIIGVVDPENSITEKNRDNNHANITLDVVSEPHFEVDIDSPEDTDEFIEGEVVTVSYTVENIGDLEGTQDIEFWVDDELQDTLEDLTLDSGDQHIDTFSFTAEDTVDGHEISVLSDDDSSVVNIQVLEDADFQVEIDSPEDTDEFIEGDTIEVEYTVENQGQVGDVRDITFKVDGLEEETQSVGLEPGEDISGEFTWQAESPFGERDLSIEADNEDVVTISVLEDARFVVDLVSPIEEDSFLEGDEVTIEYNVSNTGGIEDTQDIEFWVDDELVETEDDLELDSGGIHIDEFTWETDEDDSGERVLEISSEDDSDSVTISVLSETFFQVEITGWEVGVGEGEDINVDYMVENIGDVADDQTIEFTIDGDHEDSDNIMLEGGDLHQSTFTWETEEGDAGDRLLEVSSEDDSDSVTVTVLERAFFEVTISPLTDEEFREGEEVRVDYTVENIGGVEDTQDIEFWVDDDLVETEDDLELDSGDTHQGHFTWTPAELDDEEATEEEKTLSIRVGDYPDESSDEVQITIYLVRDLDFENISWLRNDEEIDIDDGLELDEMETLTFNAQVRNNGTRNIEDARVEYIFPDGTEYTDDISVLVGERENVSAEWTAGVPDEDDTITVRINATEGDNYYSERTYLGITVDPLDDIVVLPDQAPDDLRPGEEGILFQGTVETEDGTPWEGLTVRVSILDGDGNEVGFDESTTNENGHFMARLMMPEESGDYEIVYEVQTHLRQRETQDITVESETIEVAGIPWWIFIVIAAIAIGGAGSVFAYTKFFGIAEMVECGNCGATISADATSCPKCNVEFDMDTVKCSECDEWIPADSDNCPECGAEFVKTGKEVQDYTERMREQYKKFVRQQKRKAEEELDKELSQKEFMDWWNDQPSFITFEDWMERKEKQRREGSKECPDCGSLNSVDAGVCQKCGTSLIDVEVEEEDESEGELEEEISEGFLEESEEESDEQTEESEETEGTEDKEEISEEDKEVEEGSEGSKDKDDKDEEEAKQKKVKKKPKKKVKKKVVKKSSEKDE